MIAAELRVEAEKARDEAKGLAEVICAPSLEETSNQILKAALRNRLVERIDGIVQELVEKTRRLEREFQKFPSLYDGKEVWVWFFTARGTPEIGYDVTTMGKGTGPLAVNHMRKKLPSEIWYMKHMSFVEAIEGLKQDILDGKYDERLGTDAAKLIFDALKDKAG